jgi:hypothetical protein
MHKQELYLRKATAIFEDSILGDLGGASTSTQFLQLDGMRANPHATNKMYTFTLKIILKRDEMVFKRKVYTLLDMVGDIGGLYDGLIVLVGFFLNFYNASNF